MSNLSFNTHIARPTLADAMERRNEHMRRYSRCLAFAAGGRPKAEAKRFVRVALHHRRMARLLTEKMREMQTESRRSDGGGYGEG